MGGVAELVLREKWPRSGAESSLWFHFGHNCFADIRDNIIADVMSSCCCCCLFLLPVIAAFWPICH